MEKVTCYRMCWLREQDSRILGQLARGAWEFCPDFEIDIAKERRGQACQAAVLESWGEMASNFVRIVFCLLSKKGRARNLRITKNL